MIMNGNPAIPPADGVFVLYEQDHEMWLAILKLNYRSGYTPVSYTHLDVYKRQVFFWRIRWD